MSGFHLLSVKSWMKSGGHQSVGGGSNLHVNWEIKTEKYYADFHTLQSL